MDAGRPFLTWQKFCYGPFSSQPVSFISTFFVLISSITIFHLFIRTETSSSALSIIPGTMSSSDEIQPNPTSSTLRGRARGRPRGRARGRARGQGCRETQRTLFSTALRSSAGSVNRSLGQESVTPLDDAPLLQTPNVQSLPELSTPSGRRSQMELAQGSSSSNETQLERIASLLLERDQLASSLSNANQRLSVLEQELHSIKVEKSALVANVDMQASEIRTLKAEKESLKNLLLDQDAGCKSDRKRQKNSDVFTGLHLQYVGVASRVLKSIPACCSRETSELCPFDSVRKRRWTRRSEIVSVNGVIIPSGSMVAPFPSDSIVRTGTYYRPSFLNESELLKEMVVQEMTANEWSKIFSTTEERTACIDAISISKKMRAKVRQCLSDELSSRKRKARDLLFTSLGYRLLHSRHIAHTEEEKQQKKEQVEDAKAKLLFKRDNGDRDFGFWRTADVTKLGATICPSNIGSLNEKVSEDNLQLFKHDVAVRVLHEFMGFSVSSVASSSESRVVEGTIATLARLDAFVATTVTCLRADGSEKVGGHRQKLYSETFSAFLPIAFAQLTEQIGAYVEDWCSEELTVSSLTLDAPQNPASCPLQRKATVEVYIPSVNRRLVAVSSQWFSEYITPYMGTIHDCYILEFDSTKRQMVPFGAYSNRTNMDEDL